MAKAKPADTTFEPNTVPVADIKAKRKELLDVRQQLEFQLNGVVNQLHLIDQLLHPKPKPKPEPDNTI